MGLVDTALSFIGLGSIPDRGATPRPSDSRLKSAADARRLFQACLQEDAPRALERAIVKGCVDGNPPYPEPRPADRRWECNLNWMKGRAIMNRTAVPYFNLFARVDYFADCVTAYQQDHRDHEQWCKTISLRFHNMLKRWKPGFNWGVQQVSFWMRLHGIGFALPEKDYDWRFRSVETGNVLAPKGSPSCLDKRVPYLFVRIPFRVTELWEKIKDEAAAKDAGWDISATRNAIKYGMRGMMAGKTPADWWSRPWEEYQRVLTNSELTASFTDGDVVNCAIMLVLEYSGKISKFIFTEFEVAGEEVVRVNPSESNANQAFLFASPNCYGEYQEAIVPFFRNTGDGSWHSVRGYAMEAFRHLETENRLLCQGVNRAFLNSSVMMQFASETARTRAQGLQVNGVIVKLPTGGEFKPVYLQGGMEDVMLMQRTLSNHLDNNLGVAAPRSMSREDGRGEQPTARQVDYTAANEASISEGEITIYYEQLDSLYLAMFKRAADPSTSDPEAKQFQKECAEAGVPKEALADMEYVRANRQSGYGSPEMGMLKFNQGKDLIPMLPEEGKENILEDMVTMLWGPEKTKRYAPREHIANMDDWQASVENDMFASGRTPIIATGQDDVIHLTSHSADAKEFLAPMEQTIQQGGKVDPAEMEKALTYVQAASPNWQAHIERLAADPSRKKEAKMFTDELQNVLSFSGKLFVEYRKAQRQSALDQEQAQQATALSALDQAKVESVRTSTALAAQKTQASIANSQAKTFAAIQLKQVKTQADIAAKNGSNGARKPIAVPADALNA